MTDQEIEELFAERVLGFVRDDFGWWWDSAKELRDRVGGCRIHPTNPLKSLEDAFAGLRAHPEWNSDILGRADGWRVGVNRDGESLNFTSDTNLNRAIVVACLRAAGVDV